MPKCLTNKEQEKYDQFQQMVAWGFTAFKEYLPYFVSRDIPEHVLGMVTDKSFQLISTAMATVRRELSADEISDLVRLGDMYFAKERALITIVELAGECEFIRNEELPSDERHGDIQVSINNLIRNGDLPIHIDDNKIELDGLKVTAEVKTSTLYALRLVFYDYSELRIKNLSIDLEAAKAIQSKIKPHLTSIAFENCAFRFSYQPDFRFDFSNLEELTEFECTDCISNNLMTMLETIESKHLTKLIIANCNMDEQHQERLMNFLSIHSKLQHLTITKHSLEFPFPNVTGQVLRLEQLEYLDLTITADVTSFTEHLQSCNPLSKLIHLNLLKCPVDSNNLTLFVENLQKMPNLQFLGLFGAFYYLFDIRPITQIPHKLSHLNEVAFDGSFKMHQVHGLLDEMSKLKRHMVISSKEQAFSPTEFKMISYVQNLNCSKLTEAFRSPLPEDLNFDSVTRLEAGLKSVYDNEGIELYENFLDKFNKLESLRVSLTGNSDLDYLELLLNNNRISTLELKFSGYFIEWKELGDILQNCRSTAVVLIGNSSGAGEVHKLVTSANADFWKNLEHLEVNSFAPYSIIELLKGAAMPKLQSLTLLFNKWFGSHIKLPSFASVHRLRIEVSSYEPVNKRTFVKFLRCFPNLTYLDIDTPEESFCEFNACALFSGLRTLKIACARIDDGREFLSNLSAMSFLTEIVLETNEGNRTTSFGIHCNFRTLISSVVQADDSVITYFRLEEPNEQLVNKNSSN